MDEPCRKIIVRIAGQMGPVGSAAAVPRLLAALWGDALDGEGVARLVSAEPNLTMRILRVANSAYYGLSGKVSSVQRAVLVLGHDAVRGIAAAGCLGRTLPSQGSAAADGTRLLRHSIATAVAAQALAEGAHLPRRNDAFISGLLHDIGIAVRSHRQTAEDQADQALLAGFSHAEVGAALISAWRLPSWLESVTLHHGMPGGAPPELRQLAYVVAIADKLAARCGFRHEEDEHQGRAEQYAEEARVPVALIERVEREVPALAAEMHGALSR